MTRQQVTSYIFDPVGATVTFSSLTNIDPTQVVCIYDATLANSPYIKHSTSKGVPLYFAVNAQTTSVTGTSNNVLHIPKQNIPPQAKSTDTLTIYYGFNTTPTIVHID